MNTIIEMDNGLKFLVLSKIKYQDDKYLFVTSISENLKFLFLKQLDENNNVSPVEDGSLITNLVKIVQQQLNEKK